MAQAKKGVRARTKGLRRRFGVSGRAWVALACAAVVVMVACVAGLRLAQGDEFVVERGEVATASVSDEGASSAPRVEETVIVHVDGAVVNPGVYELAGVGARVNDAVLAAGGFVEGSDTSTINLASPVEDGSKVHVPTADELVSTPPAEADAASGGLVNINTATSGQLQSLPGVGEATAAAIIQDRERSGPFSSCEDLMRVSGIGEKKYAKMEALICV